MSNPETTIPIPTLTQDQKDYIAKLDKANVRPGDPRLQEPLVTPQTTEPDWTAAEHDEIMRLHIIEGFTISEAKLAVFERREAVNVYKR